MEFYLNGQKKKFNGDENLSLLKYLRNCEGITTPKDGCSGDGSCGACTVQLEDGAVFSCKTKMKDVVGKKVITTDGIGQKFQDAFANAFISKGGIQCGFCIPGIVMRAKVLIESNPNPTVDDIVKMLKKHICRCTGYKKIIESILAAAAIVRGDEKPKLLTDEGKVGSRYPKYDTQKAVLGMRPYVCDISVANMHHAALRLSDFPRAKVLKIDTTEAEKVSGVIRVVTAKDVTGQRYNGLIVMDWPLFIEVGEETRYIGDVLAGVIATTEEIAREASAKIKVEYDVFEPICDVDEALLPTSPSIHPKGNLLALCEINRGHAEQVLQQSAFVTEGTYYTQRIEHAFIEPECCLAEPWMNQGQMGVQVYSQSQGVYEDRKAISRLLGIPQERINVIQVQNGGGFGGKEDLLIQGHASLFSFLTHLPVRLALTREESMLMHPKRHPVRLKYKVGCDKNGKLTAMTAEIHGDTGAYASVGMKVLERAAGHATGAYNVPCAHIKAYTVYTNNIPSGAMRGFGVNQATFVMERCVDELCEMGGFDRWQFRYDNALVEGSVVATGQKLKEAVAIRETLLAVKDEFQKAKYAGLACGIKNCGIGNGMADTTQCRIDIVSPTRVEIHHGWTEMGQGVHTMALQSLVEETGIDPHFIVVINETKSEVPVGMTTSSRGTSLIGHAVIVAAKKMKEDLKRNLLKDLVGKSYHGEWICDWTTKPGYEKPGQEPITHYSYSYATQCVILDEQGAVKKVIAAHDAGRIMNPTLFEGQIEGAVHMGLGYALSEDYPMEKGRPLHTKLGRLGIIKVHHTPEIKVIGIEKPDPHGPYGAKGIGEIGMVPTAAAVACALYQFDKIKRYSLPLLKDNSEE